MGLGILSLILGVNSSCGISVGPLECGVNEFFRILVVGLFKEGSDGLCRILFILKKNN